jgi:hypothetical protein
LALSGAGFLIIEATAVVLERRISPDVPVMKARMRAHSISSPASR